MNLTFASQPKKLMIDSRLELDRLKEYKARFKQTGVSS